jgi:hypothetical protein
VNRQRGTQPGALAAKRDAERSRLEHLAQLEDLAIFLRRYVDQIDASPAKLQQVEERLALLERLKPDIETNVQARASAARALGQYQQPRVAQALISAIGERNLAVNQNALESLRILTGENFGYDDRAWLKWLNGTKEPFANGAAYTYPVFERDKKFVEWILPFIPGPPNETPGPVIGSPAVASATPAPAKPEHEEKPATMPIEEGASPPAKSGAGGAGTGGG